MPAFLIKPLLYVLAVALIVGGIWYHGYSYANNKNEIEALEQAAANADMLVEVVKQTEAETRLLYEEEIKRLKKKPLPDKCVLSADFRRMHDSATGVPESPTQATVTAQDVADTVAGNYLACRQNIIWLNECQRICQ